jgi:hypothetical protein
MNKYINFVPPKCNIVVIEKRKLNYWKVFEIIRSDGKKYIIVGRTYSYDKKKNILTIKLYNNCLPVILEIEKEFLIDNSKNNGDDK